MRFRLHAYTCVARELKFAVQYLNCLTTMHELDEENDRELPGFLEYTKLWVEKVNRGGLFLVDGHAPLAEYIKDI